MVQKKYFGTDGIRNRVGKGLMRPDQVLKLGWAVGKVIKQRGGSKVVIGKDTRISGYMFESALEAGLIYAGIDVLLLGPMPTPGVSYLTRTFHADLGIVISASHNPHYDNGIKFFNAQGAKLSDEFELEIERVFEESFEQTEDSLELDALGKARRIDDAAGRYIEFCKSTYDAPKSLEGLHLVVDAANGAAYDVAPKIFDELGAKVTAIGINPDGLNINQNCGATDLVQLQQKVLEEQADLGIALDGDADRVMLVDAQGRVVDGDDILYLMAVNLPKAKPGVVGTLMTNLGIEQALKDKGFELIRTAVGDRYVNEALLERGWDLGAEGSGHVLCLHKTPTGDGLVAALQILSILQTSQKNLADLLEGVQKSHQELINVRLDKDIDLENNIKLQEEIKEFENKYSAQGRVLIRKSGTEPVVRVMVEAVDKKLAQNYAKTLADTLAKSS